jgi:hypothetical protein
VTAAADFTVTPFPCNPAMPITFPWLSNIAANYEKYRFKSLCFDYLTSTGTEGTGSVILVPDFNASAPPPVTKAMALTMKDSVRGSVWQDFCSDFKGKDLSALPQYFTRSQALPANQDIKTYDTANLNLCVDGAGAESGSIGELWVEYDVELIAPAAQPQEGGALEMLQGAFFPDIVAAAAPLPTAPGATVTPGNLIGNGWNWAQASKTVTFTVAQRNQAYLIAIENVGTGLGDITASSTLAGNTVTLVDQVINGGTTSMAVFYYDTSLGTVGQNDALTFSYTCTTLTANNIFVGALVPGISALV